MGLEVLKFLDDAETVGDAEALGRPVARGAVVAVDADFAEDADWLESIEALVKTLNEIPPAHLAIGNDVDAGPFLVEDGQIHRVVEGLANVGRAIFAGVDCLERRPQPARNRVAADHGRGKQAVGLGHCSSRSGARYPAL